VTPFVLWLGDPRAAGDDDDRFLAHMSDEG
jgi:hypothetical protein